MRCTLLALVCLLGSLAGTLSCSAPVRPYACTVEPQGTDVDVHSIWSCNREILRRAARGKKFSMREFRAAVAFFEDVVGLRVDTRPSHLDVVLPGENLTRDLEVLDVWYVLHQGKLRWDSGLRKVVFAGLAPAPGEG